MRVKTTASLLETTQPSDGQRCYPGTCSAGMYTPNMQLHRTQSTLPHCQDGMHPARPSATACSGPLRHGPSGGAWLTSTPPTAPLPPAPVRSRQGSSPGALPCFPLPSAPWGASSVLPTLWGSSNRPLPVRSCGPAPHRRGTRQTNPAPGPSTARTHQAEQTGRKLLFRSRCCEEKLAGRRLFPHHHLARPDTAQLTQTLPKVSQNPTPADQRQRLGTGQNSRPVPLTFTRLRLISSLAGCNFQSFPQLPSSTGTAEHDRSGAGRRGEGRESCGGGCCRGD